MSNSYTGGKNGSGVYQKIISMMPPHKIYVEGFLGSGAILRRKKPAEYNFGIELDPHAFKADKPFPDATFVEIVNESFFDFVSTLPEFLSKRFYQPNETLIYCDPPYLASTRSSQRQYYRYEMMSEAEHTEFLTTVLELPYLVMISGYESDLYNDLLSGWRKESFWTTNRAGKHVKEFVWLNFPKPLELHDYSFLGENYRERQDINRQRERWIKRLAEMPEQKRFALMSAIDEFRLNGKNADISRQFSDRTA